MKQMIEDDPYHLTSLWDALQSIYEEFRRVCDKNKLRHWIGYGTLLGAVRHNGFIPWDDDFDVVMPRVDYNRFKEIARRELPSHLKFVDHYNSPEFKKHFGKVQDARKDVVLSVEKQVGHMLSGGIYIDVFPIDGYPPRGVKRQMDIFVGRAYGAIHFYHDFKKVGYRLTPKWVVAYAIGMLLSIFVGRVARGERGFVWNDRRLSRINFDPDRVSAIAGNMHGWFELILEPGIFSRTVELPFRNTTVSCPVGWHSFLERLYGDFMKLPPEEKRHPTHVYKSRCEWWLGPTISNN